MADGTVRYVGLSDQIYTYCSSVLTMDQVVRIHDWRVPSAHVACYRFTNYPCRIFLSKLLIGDGFPRINSAAQLFTVGYSFLIIDMKGFLQNKKFIFMFLLIVAQWKYPRASPKLSFWQIYRFTHKGCDFNDDCRAFIRSYFNKLIAFQSFTDCI